MEEDDMADDKSDRGPQDRSRVNVHEDYEVAYWTDKWGVTASKLREAVVAVGVSADAVEQYIKRGAEGERGRVL
jgi:hypothetical protein